MEPQTEMNSLFICSSQVDSDQAFFYHVRHDGQMHCQGLIWLKS